MSDLEETAGYLESGEGWSIRLRFNALPLRIGRRPDNDLIVDNLFCSRIQCELTTLDGCLAVRDLGSRHGTIVGMGLALVRAARIEKTQRQDIDKPGQSANLLDLTLSIGRAEPLDSLALEGPTAAVAPSDEITALLAPRLADVLHALVPLTSHEPPTEALEVERRQLLEGERVRGSVSGALEPRVLSSILIRC